MYEWAWPVQLYHPTVPFSPAKSFFMRLRKQDDPESLWDGGGCCCCIVPRESNTQGCSCKDDVTCLKEMENSYISSFCMFSSPPTLVLSLDLTKLWRFLSYVWCMMYSRSPVVFWKEKMLLPSLVCIASLPEPLACRIVETNDLLC